MYSGFVITSRGAEEIAAIEIPELIKCYKIVKEDTVVKFEFNDLSELCLLSYKAQSINKVVLLLSELIIDSSLDDSMHKIKKVLKNIDFSLWRSKSFRVECLREGEHDFNSVDIEIETGKEIYKITKNKVDFENPEVIFYLYVLENRGYLGIDYSGIELAKRQYKVFNHPESLKGTTGYILVREAGFKDNMTLVDPFMGSGVIVIEAALFALQFPVQYYNKEKLLYCTQDFFKKQDRKIQKIKTKIYGFDSQFRYLKAAQKNSKLAGVDKYLNLSKAEIEWLDTKLDKNSVDLIVSDPPRSSKHRDDKLISKVYNELFYQADYVLKKTGSIVLIVKDYALIEEAAKKHKFNINKKTAMYQGKEVFNIITFVRGI